jgi:hypothetical protein
VKLRTQDWIGLIELGITTTTQLLEARAKRKAELAQLSPELAEMSQADFDAKFDAYYTAEDRLAAAAAALVEAGSAEKSGG